MGYFLNFDREAYERQCAEYQLAHPLHMAEVIEIQRQTRNLDDMLREHMLSTLPEDPLTRLQSDLAEMCNLSTISRRVQ